MEIVDRKIVDEAAVTRVWSVAEFCERYQLGHDEEARLRKLLGDFANQTELLMNARRKPVFR